MPMNEEIWKDIEGYEGYQVSNLGNVRSLDRVIIRSDGMKNYYKGKPLSIDKTWCGYLRVFLSKDGLTKAYKVHRLVAQAFIPNPDNLPQVNHINEIKTDNRVENLEWVSAKDNCNYGTRTKRSAKNQINHPNKSKKVYQYTLDNQLVKVWESTQECGRNGYDYRNVSACCVGKRNKYKGFIWRYN